MREHIYAKNIIGKILSILSFFPLQLKAVLLQPVHDINDTNGGLYYPGTDVIILLLTGVLTEHRQGIYVHIYIYYSIRIKFI